MMRRLGLGAVVCGLLSITGCVGPWINQPTSMSAQTSIDERFILAPVVPGAGARSDDGAPIVAAVDRAIAPLFRDSGLLPRLIREQDAPATLPAGRVYLIRFDVTNLVVTQDLVIGPKVASAVLCGMCILPACVGFAARGAQHPVAETIVLTTEMRVFDVAGAAVRMFEGETGSPRRIDISGNTPVAVMTYEARVSARRGGRLDRGEAHARFNAEMAADLTRQIVQAASRDLPRIVTGPAATSGDW